MLILSDCIFDSVKDEPYKGYIRIEDEKIVQVGKGRPTDFELPGEEVIDCGNKTVMAAFCDNHVHVFLAALDLATCNLSGAANEEEAAEKLYNYYDAGETAGTENDGGWIISFGWSHYDWDVPKLPKKKSLDKYFPDRPVIAVNDELHALWVNSRALEICGITKDTPDPPYAIIAKDENGEPTGYILEQAAMRCFTDRAFSFTKDREKQIVQNFIKKAYSVGVTSFGDMKIVGVMKHELFREIAEEGNLGIRIFFSPAIDTDIDKLESMKDNFKGDRLAFLGAKGFIDGTPLGMTGMLCEDYSNRPGFRGEPVLDLDWLKERIYQLNRRGIPVRLHACGDGAVKVALDYIEESNRRRKAEGDERQVRNTIEHIENIREEDLQRFKETGTIASIQSYHMSMDSIEGHPIFGILGKIRSKLAWPARSLKNKGARLTIGTDCPIVPLSPLKTVFCATNRVMEDGSPQGGWNPEEKLSLAEALKASTIETAYLFGREDKLGSLEAGKLADVIVMSENIFEKDPLEVEEVYVERTIFNGKTVYTENGKTVYKEKGGTDE